MLRLLDLFSGFGGFSLGMERTGRFRTVAFCEIDPFRRRGLAKHWPGVPCYEDIRALTAERLRADGIAVDAICGGFPCQDVSSASASPAGIGGSRSGLWSEFARLVRDLRPQLVLVENVASLLGRGIDQVLGDLASLGYDAEWHCIPASAVGAPHPRDRVWIMAYAPEMFGAEQRGHQQGRILSGDGLCSLIENKGRGNPISDWWRAEPNVDRVVYGIPDRVDRFGSLSDAVVPQIPEIIGRAILATLPLFPCQPRKDR